MFKFINMGFISMALFMGLFTSCSSTQLSHSGERQVKSAEKVEASQDRKELECRNRRNKFKYQEFRGTGRT